MKVLVTGGDGFVAGYVCEALDAGGIDVYAPGKALLDITCVDDFRDNPELEGVDAVIHLAALLMIDGHTPQQYFDVNALGTLNVLEYCRKAGIKNFIYAMTHSDTNKSKFVTIYDDNLPEYGTGGWEKNSIPFITSKVAAMNMVQAYNRMGVLNGKILRLSNIRGVGSADTKYGCVFHQFIQKAKKGHPIEIWGNPPKTIRDMIYVKDVARAFLHALMYPGSGVYNIGSGVGYTILEEAKAIIEVFGGKSEIIYRPDMEEYRKVSCIFNCRRAEEELNWKPKYSYRDGLADMKDIMEREGD